MKLEPILPTATYAGEKYMTEDCRNLLSVYAGFYSRTGINPPWTGYLICDADTVYGTCGFTAQPDHNRVELAYYTFKPFEGRGIASFGCGELIAIARNEQPGIIITAKTEPRENASTSILKKHGFRYSGIVQDHEIGDAWEWICE
jgi:RimJ/RimL family protein N-acetyltransferase